MILVTMQVVSHSALTRRSLTCISHPY